MKVFRILAITLLIAVGLSVMTSCSVEIGGFRISPIPNPDDIAHNLKMLGIIKNDGEGDSLNDGEGEQITIEFRPGNIFDKPSYDADGRPSDGAIGTDSCKHDWSEEDCEAERRCYSCGTLMPPTYDNGEEIRRFARQFVGALTVQNAETNLWCGGTAFLINWEDSAEYDAVVTTYHSLLNTKAATFHLGDDKYEVSDVLAYDEHSDLAVLRIEKTGAAPTPICYEIHAADQPVYAVYESSKAVAHGEIISSECTVNGVAYIEHSARSERGFDGGALFNGYGEIIGINTDREPYKDGYYSYAISVHELNELSPLEEPIPYEEMFGINEN